LDFFNTSPQKKIYGPLFGRNVEDGRQNAAPTGAVNDVPVASLVTIVFGSQGDAAPAGAVNDVSVGAAFCRPSVEAPVDRGGNLVYFGFIRYILIKKGAVL
jgi:hypothetical protein